MITIIKINKKELFHISVLNKILFKMPKIKFKNLIKMLILKLIICFRTNLWNKTKQKNNQY